MLEKILKLKNVIKDVDEVTLTTHKNADPDAAASIIALNKLIKHINPKITVHISLPEGLSGVSKKLLNAFNLTIEAESDIVGNVVIVVDTSSSYQLGLLRDKVLEKKIILIDHHTAGDLVNKAYLSIIDRNASSTTEIVYRMIKALGVELNANELSIVLSGIVYDTRHFILAKPETLIIAADLMLKGANYKKVLNSMFIPPTISEKIAKIKAALRMQAYRLKDIIVILTRIGAFEASVARSLIDVGADVVFVVCKRKNETRLIARASQSFKEVTKIHLGKDILEQLKKYFPQGSGGGHDLAGGFTGIADPDLLLSMAFKVLVDKLVERKIISYDDVEKITLE